MSQIAVGAIRVSAQMYDEIARNQCEARASDIYAWLGKRTDDCICGQHEGQVPIAPLLLDDERV